MERKGVVLFCLTGGVGDVVVFRSNLDLTRLTDPVWAEEKSPLKDNWKSCKLYLALVLYVHHIVCLKFLGPSINKTMHLVHFKKR